MGWISVSKRARYWAFAALLLTGAAGYVVIDRIERRAYTGPTQTIIGEVLESVYLSRGTMTGKSYVRVQLSDGEFYRLPPGQGAAQVGTKLELVVPIDGRRTLEGERVVVRSRVAE